MNGQFVSTNGDTWEAVQSRKQREEALWCFKVTLQRSNPKS